MAGIYDRAGQSSLRSLNLRIEAMTEAHAFRGPDDRRYRIEHGYGVGAARLKITDTGENSAQPFVRHDRWTTCFNGEIYNFREFEEHGSHEPSSEVAVISNLLTTKGKESLCDLKGMYALCHYDKQSHSLLLARSPIGKKPLYWYQYDGEIVFASTITAIKACVGGKLPIDEDAIPEYLIFRTVGGFKSAFKDIQTVPPGSWIEFRGHTISKGSFWTVPRLTSSDGDHEHTIVADFDHALNRRLQYDGPVAISVSGGFDSSLVACLAARHRERESMRFFSIGYDLEDEADERRYARAIAEQTGVTLTDMTLKSSDIPRLIDESALLMEDPNQDPVVVPTLVLAKRIQEYTKVVLTGDGSDEIWGGYERFNKPIPSLEAYLPLTQIFTPRELGLDEFPASYNQGIEWPDTNLPVLDQVFRYELSNRLRNYHLSRMDKIYAGNAIEARSPFLDVDFVDLGLSIPASVKRRGGRAKALLMDAFQNAVPKWLTEREKQPFSLPLVQLFKGPLNEYARETVCDPRGVAQRYVDCGAVGNLLDKPSVEMTFNDVQKIWSICFLNRWYNVWFPS